MHCRVHACTYISTGRKASPLCILNIFSVANHVYIIKKMLLILTYVLQFCDWLLIMQDIKKLKEEISQFTEAQKKVHVYML